MTNVFFKVTIDKEGRWKAVVECFNCGILMTYHQAKGFEHLSPKPISRNDLPFICQKCHKKEVA